MTQIYSREILLNSIVLVPDIWIAHVQSHVGLEFFDGDSLPNAAILCIVSDNPFESLAACTVLHHMVQLGAVTLTDYGVQQAGSLWIEPTALAGLELDTASNS